VIFGNAAIGCKRDIARLLAGLLTSLLVNFAAHAEDAAPSSRLDVIIERGTLRVGMTGDYMPSTHLDRSSRKYSGFDVDMAEALGKAMGVKIEFVHEAHPRDRQSRRHQ
jgi:cyclohexadienyl dehydratase